MKKFKDHFCFVHCTENPILGKVLNGNHRTFVYMPAMLFTDIRFVGLTIVLLLKRMDRKTLYALTMREQMNGTEVRFTLKAYQDKRFKKKKNSHFYTSQKRCELRFFSPTISFSASILNRNSLLDNFHALPF